MTEVKEVLINDFVSWEKAREILGPKAVGIDVATKLGLEFSEEELARWQTVPFTEKELLSAQSLGLYLFAIPEIDLDTLNNLPDVNFNILYPEDWNFDRKSRGGYRLIWAPSSWIKRDRPYDNQYLVNQFEVEGIYACPTIDNLYLFCAWLKEHNELFADCFLESKDTDPSGWKMSVGVYKDWPNQLCVSSENTFGSYIDGDLGEKIFQEYRSLV